MSTFTGSDTRPTGNYHTEIDEPPVECTFRLPGKVRIIPPGRSWRVTGRTTSIHELAGDVCPRSCVRQAREALEIVFAIR